jgi:hypothetical protein
MTTRLTTTVNLKIGSKTYDDVFETTWEDGTTYIHGPIYDIEKNTTQENGVYIWAEDIEITGADVTKFSGKKVPTDTQLKKAAKKARDWTAYFKKYPSLQKITEPPPLSDNEPENDSIGEVTEVSNNKSAESQESCDASNMNIENKLFDDFVNLIPQTPKVTVKRISQLVCEVVTNRITTTKLHVSAADVQSFWQEDICNAKKLGFNFISKDYTYKQMDGVSCTYTLFFDPKHNKLHLLNILNMILGTERALHIYFKYKYDVTSCCCVNLDAVNDDINGLHKSTNISKPLHDLVKHFIDTTGGVSSLINSLFSGVRREEINTSLDSKLPAIYTQLEDVVSSINNEEDQLYLLEQLQQRLRAKITTSTSSSSVVSSSSSTSLSSPSISSSSSSSSSTTVKRTRTH